MGALRGKGPAEVGRAIMSNRQFVAMLTALALVVLFFPGSPAPSLFSDTGERVVPAPHSGAATQPGAGEPGSPALAAAAGTEESPGAPRPLPPGLPPAPTPPPPPECDTDALADVIDSARTPLGEALGFPLPGGAFRDLAAIATGCSDKDPSEPVIDLWIELLELFPDTGLDPVELPNVRPLIPDPGEFVPREIALLLMPVAEPVRAVCGTPLALIVLLVQLSPSLMGLPVRGDDLLQFLKPLEGICGLFDEELED